MLSHHPLKLRVADQPPLEPPDMFNLLFTKTTRALHSDSLLPYQEENSSLGYRSKEQIKMFPTTKWKQVKILPLGTGSQLYERRYFIQSHSVVTTERR